MLPVYRFTKNLSPDKINLSTLKGEGQLSNLELDEEVLQNMLDLPTWLSISRVYCNKAAIRVRADNAPEFHMEFIFTLMLQENILVGWKNF